jgi:hypothetical protein
LTLGRYEVSVEHPGFRKSISEELTLISDRTARYDFTLEVGDINQTVRVTAATPLIDVAESVVGDVVNQRLVQNLPVNGRNLLGFSSLTTNISSFPRSNTGTTWNTGANQLVSGSDTIPGGGGDTGFYMNGANINDNYMGSVAYAPSIEAVTEIKLDTANFSAEYGRDVATMSITTRGGTNQYHGSVYEFFENNALNAWNPYIKAQSAPDQKKEVLQRNQFGGNIGGPVLIPRLHTKDKFFFFVNYEGFREHRGGVDQIFRVPTAAERQGDFSAMLRRFPGDPNFVLWNPFSTKIDQNGNSIRQPIPNNDLRTIGINADAAHVLDLMPLPNGYQNPQNPNDLRNYRGFQAQGSHTNRVDMRADFRLTNNDNIYYAYSTSYENTDNAGGVIPELVGNLPGSSWLTTANWAHVFSPHATNEFSFSKNIANLNSADDRLINYLHRLDTPRSQFFKNFGTGADQGFGAINFEGLDPNPYPSYCCDEIFFAEDGAWQLSDNFSLVKGAHSIKTGFTYNRKKVTAPDYVRRVTFDRTFTRSGSLDSSLGGDPIADLLLGLPTSIEQRFNFGDFDPEKYDIIPFWGFFVDDKWQVTPKLTVSLGLRYDLFIPPYHQNKYGFAKIDFSVPGWQLQIPGRAPDVPWHFASADKRNFAPRIGVAYRIKSDFVARLAYGIFYDGGMQNTGSSLLDAAGNTIPDVSGDIYNNERFGIPNDLPYLKFGDIFPAAAPVNLCYPVCTAPGTGYYNFVKSVNYMDEKSWRTPYYQRYLVELQKGFGSTTVTASYLGGRGTRLPYWENINKPAYRTGWPDDVTFDAARPNNSGRFGDVYVLRKGNNSFYNAVTIKAERRLTSGLQFLAHYTFSKTVLDPTTFHIYSQPFYDFQFDWNRQLGRGEAEFSHPHRFVTALTYETPWGKNLSPLARGVLAGWIASTIVTFESGNAEPVFNVMTSARDHEPDVANVSGDPNLPRGQRDFYHMFNTAAFSAPPMDVKGNAGLGIVRGPGINNWDIALTKNFKPVERMNVRFRGDFFNAFNHTQWSGVDTTFNTASNSTFGFATGAREPRIMQLGLTVSF